MAVDRLSVTVPSQLGRALRKLAKARGTTVSNVVTEAVAQQIRLAALDLALEDADRRFGPVPTEAVDEAEQELALARTRPPARRAARR